MAENVDASPGTVTPAVGPEAVPPGVGLTGAEIPPTHKAASEETWKLVETDRFARSLVAILKRKRENWEEDIYGLPTNREVNEITQRDVSDAIAWLGTSSDFRDVNEVNRWLEEKLMHSFDTRFTQVGGPVYGNLWGDSARYRIARDKLFEIIRPYLILYKRHPTWQEMNYWASIPAAAGGPPLKDKDELLARYRFERVEYGSIVFYCAQGYDRRRLEEIVKIDGQIRQLMGNKLEARRRTHILIPPEEKYSPRGAAGAERVILRPGEHLFRNATHELVHSQLAQAFGYSQSASAAEGAAMYFARMLHPGDPLNDYATFPIGSSEIEHVLQTDPSLGVSHTQLLEKAGLRGKLPVGMSEYEYAYRFGGFLAEYIVGHFGVDAYLAFYQRTCSRNLFDGESGKQLVRDGVKVADVGQREVNRQALRYMLATLGRGGITPEQIEQEFAVYMRRRIGE